MPPQHSLNPIDAVVGVLTLAMSPVAAAVIGPYAAVILASTAGASWSVGRRDPADRTHAVWFFCRINLTAFTISAGVAVIVEQWLGPETRQWTVAPIALMIGAVGDNWPKVVTKVFNILLRAFGKKIAGDDR